MLNFSKIVLEFLLGKIAARLILKIMLKSLHIVPEYKTKSALEMVKSSLDKWFLIQIAIRIQTILVCY